MIFHLAFLCTSLHFFSKIICFKFKSNFVNYRLNLLRHTFGTHFVVLVPDFFVWKWRERTPGYSVPVRKVDKFYILRSFLSTWIQIWRILIESGSRNPPDSDTKLRYILYDSQQEGTKYLGNDKIRCNEGKYSRYNKILNLKRLILL